MNNIGIHLRVSRDGDDVYLRKSIIGSDTTKDRLNILYKPLLLPLAQLKVMVEYSLLVSKLWSRL